jgi:coenzyme F420-dependent glucose-6-phosphate dehydrogenase
MSEAIDLIRALWSAERVDFEGEYYRTSRATIYERPAELVPIYVAASGPLAAKLVGRKADGFICTSGKPMELYRTLLDNVAEGAAKAGRDAASIANMIEIKVSYDRDPDYAEQACRWWGALALTGEEKTGVEDPLELERLADAHPERASSRFIVSNDPEEVVERVAPYVELGFSELVFHGPGADQERFLEGFTRDVLPRLRARWG